MKPAKPAADDCYDFSPETPNPSCTGNGGRSLWLKEDVIADSGSARGDAGGAERPPCRTVGG